MKLMTSSCISWVPLCNKIVLKHIEREGRNAEVIRSHRHKMAALRALNRERELNSKRSKLFFFLSS